MCVLLTNSARDTLCFGFLLRISVFRYYHISGIWEQMVLLFDMQSQLREVWGHPHNSQSRIPIMSNSLLLHQYQFHFICSKQQGIWLPSDHANVTYTRTSQHHLQLLFGHKMVWVHRVYQMTQRGLDCTASKCSTILSKCSINKPLGLVTLLLSFESRYNVNFKFKIGLYFWLVLYFDFSWATC